MLNLILQKGGFMSESENQVVNQEEMPGFYSKKFKTQALKQLNGRWTTPVLVNLVCAVISFALIALIFPWEFYIQTIMSAINGYGEPDMSAFPFVRYFVGLLLTFFISPVIAMAQLSIYPVLYKTKEPVKFSEFISGFSLWGKAIGAFWWQYLWLMLWAWAGAAAGLVAGGIFAGVIFVFAKEAMVFAFILPIFIYIALIAVMLVKGYQYSFTEWVIVDNNEVKVTQALNISKKLTKGYKWKLFCLDFSFIGWGILVAIFPIGGLWLSPYQFAAYFSAYRYVLDEFNKNMEAQTAAEKPRAIEDEPVSAEVDSSDGNEC